MRNWKLVLTVLGTTIVIMNLSCIKVNATSFEGFQRLIDRYGAYEALEGELTTRTLHSPEVILKIARIKILLNKPKGAISLLQGKAFSSNKYEGRRLLLLGDAYRMLGDFKKGLIYYAQARNYFTTRQMTKIPKFYFFWSMGIRRWIWQYIYNGNCLLHKNEISYLENVVLTGKLLWNSYSLWDEARRTCSFLSRGLLPLPIISPLDLRNSLLKFFAYISLSDFTKAKEIVKSFPTLSQRKTLLYLLELIQGKENLNFSSDHLPKLGALLDLLPCIVRKICHDYPDGWTISYPIQKGFDAFKERLLSLSPKQALSLVESQISSPLLSPSQKKILRMFKLAFLLMTSNYQRAREEVSGLSLNSLPISLKLSLLLITPTPSFISSPQVSDAYKFSLILLQPFGLNICKLNSPFGVSTEQLALMVKKFPLDMLLYYSYLKKLIIEKPTEAPLKAMGFLFPYTPVGKDALISLAQLELKKGNPLKSAAYLKMIKFNYLTRELVDKYYLAMAELMEEEGQKDIALSYYNKLLEISPSSVPPIKFLKIALYAQQVQKWEEAQKFLLYLWNNKDKLHLSREMQAEVLFWLAEGDQQMGKEDRAIERYLKVYWFYKDQYIWSITALYRTGLIYEKQGNLIVAKRIFSDVVKNARRKSEREAARERIKAINNFNGILSSSPYLF